MTFREKITTRSKERVLTQTELAEAIGVEAPSLVEMLRKSELRPVKLTANMWRKLMLALDVDLDYFCDDDIEDEKIQTLLTLKAIRNTQEAKERDRMLRQKYKEAMIKSGLRRKPRRKKTDESI